MATKPGTVIFTTLLIGASLLAIGMVSGVFYEQAQRARDRERLPQIGRSVDIGGRMMNIECSGAGQPAVILESGATWPFLKEPKTMFENGVPRPGYIWVRIQRELAKFTTTCWYDRAGSGWSDLGPYPRDSASQARDLHALLEGAGVRPPYVLVAESSAALDAHVYAGFYADEVAGLVLVNGEHPDLLMGVRPQSARMVRFPGFVGHSQDLVAELSNQMGLYRLGLKDRPAPAPPPEGMSDSEWDTIWRLTQASKARTALIQDIASRTGSSAEARAAGSLGDRPVIVMSGGGPVVGAEHSRLWAELQADLARLSTRGKVMTVERDGDPIYQAPGAIVEAVGQVLGEVRLGGRAAITPASATPLPASPTPPGRPTGH